MLLFDWFYPDYSAGGPVRSCINLIEQTKKDINWFVLTSNTTYETKQINETLPVKSWIKMPFGGQVMYVSALENRTFLKQVFKEKKWKSIYVNSIYSAFFGFQAVSMAKQLRLNTIVCPRGMLAAGSVKQKWWLKIPFLKVSKALGWYNQVTWHATNSTEAENINRWYKNAKITIIANVVGKPTNVKRQTPKGQNALRVLCVSRIAPEKNVLFIIERLASLALVNVTLTLVGSVYNDKYANQIKLLAAKHHIIIDWKGHLDPADIEKSLLDYDLFMLPTLGENYGHAIVEALRAGLPVLISDNTPWSQVEESQAGFAISLHDKEQFERVISDFYAMDEDAWLTWHEGAKQFFKRAIFANDVSQQYVQLFTKES